MYIHEEKDGFYSIEFFRDVVSDAENLLESTNLQKGFRPVHRENLDLPANQNVWSFSGPCKKGQNDIMSWQLFKNLKEANNALVYIRFVEHLMQILQVQWSSPSIQSLLRYPRRQARMPSKAALTAM